MAPRSSVPEGSGPAPSGSCQACGLRPATVRLTANHTAVALCPACLRRRGSASPAAGFDAYRFCASLFQEGRAPREASAPGATPTACGACGLTLKEMMRTGMAGCPACYTAFAAVLEPVLRPGG